ncbi:hypothetical protein J7F03_03660 [Streptomyces sp. ISL-43]|uniref:hypothetical protein n=1 Tax=Streptomyces sp. ISL-43 TaxID=2819183 RepID=UPI001BED0745|nr:hypothetical protein [Streptomyces sp. ISL-43]MBT2446199.1 hypothetical protein [Streptomyces sp. ISL-43]
MLALLDRPRADTATLPIIRARRLLQLAETGDGGAAMDLVDLVADRPRDYELHVHALVLLHADVAGPVLSRNIPQATEILHALASHTRDENGSWPEFQEMDQVMLWLWRIARYADRTANWDLLEAAATALFTWDASYDQWTPQDSIRPWLAGITGHAAHIVASLLREHPGSACHYSAVAADRRAHQEIRAAVFTTD